MAQTYRHVKARSGESTGDGINRLSTDAKVAELDRSIPSKQDVAWFDVSVHNFALM